MIKLVGLHGKARSGKDTVYKLLNDQLDMPLARDAFADRLKLSAIRNFFPDVELEEAYRICEGLKDGGELSLFTGADGLTTVSGREFLQHYGTEAHREVFADDFWVSAVLPDLDDKLTFGRTDDKPWSLLVVTDVRFPNEAQAIHDAGGVVWHIVRPELEQGEQDTHASEIPLDPQYLDLRIDNDGSLEDLADKVLQAWKFSALKDELRSLPA